MPRFLAALLLAVVVPAQGVTLEVSTHAGDVARASAPAFASFAWPAALTSALEALDVDTPVLWSAELVTASSKRPVPCEVLATPGRDGEAARGELRFVVAQLPPQAEEHYHLQLGDTTTSATAFAGKNVDNARELQSAGSEGRPLLRLETAFDRADFERTSKPIWHLFLPGTDVQLTKGVGGEFSHHRGLFLGFNKTTIGGTTFDFWHCPDAGQRHAGYDAMREIRSAVRGDLASTTHWVSPTDEIVVRDRRTLTAWQQLDGKSADAPWTVDVAIELSADQVVTLRGDPQHAGFQLRVADEVAQRKDARYVRPASAKDAKNDVWIDCPWVAGLFTIGGRQVAIQHMSHPDNPQPVSYSTRPYGRFGAFFTADLTPNQPLRLRYRLVVVPMQEGTNVTSERFADAYADFANPIEVRVRA